MRYVTACDARFSDTSKISWPCSAWLATVPHANPNVDPCHRSSRKYRTRQPLSDHNPKWLTTTATVAPISIGGPSGRMRAHSMRNVPRHERRLRALETGLAAGNHHGRLVGVVPRRRMAGRSRRADRKAAGGPIPRESGQSSSVTADVKETWENHPLYGTPRFVRGDEEDGAIRGCSRRLRIGSRPEPIGPAARTRAHRDQLAAARRGTVCPRYR